MHHLFPILLFATVLSFLIRWAINWHILNKQNKTKFSILRPMYMSKNYVLFTRHVIQSEWILYWENRDNSKPKRAANILSLLTILLLIATLGSASPKWQ